MNGWRFLSRVALPALLALGGCTSTPDDQTGNGQDALRPVFELGVTDNRGRFREVLCAVLEKHGRGLPDYRPCGQALTLVGVEPPGNGEPVDLAGSRTGLLAGFVPGFGWNCFKNWLDVADTVGAHLESQGYASEAIPVDGLSGTLVNAGLIRDWVYEVAARGDGRPLVLVGYSKGTPDILEFLVNYPDAARHVSAVVSVAGAVGGSTLAVGSNQDQAEMLLHVPGSECDKGDRGAVESLLPEVRQRWLAEHRLPQDIPTYTVVTFPHPDRISRVLKRGYSKLAKIDTGNDSQLIYYDQVVPESALLAFVNADHWALAVPVDRSHPFIGDVFVDHNDFPREAFMEAVLRFVEEDLATRERVRQ